MSDQAGPIGFQHIETAPRDGTLLRLRFRRVENEAVGRWVAIEEMKAGGAWFDQEANYITPGPIFWAPYNPPPGYTQYTGYRP